MKWHLTAASLAFGNIFWTHHHKLHSGHFSKAIQPFKKENIPQEKWIHVRNLGIQKKMIVGVEEWILLYSFLSDSHWFTVLYLKIPLEAPEWFFRMKWGTKPWQHSGSGTAQPLSAAQLPLRRGFPHTPHGHSVCALLYKDDTSQRTLRPQLLINTCSIIRITLSVVLARWSCQGEALQSCGFDLLDAVIDFWDERTKICVKIIMATV